MRSLALCAVAVVLAGCGGSGAARPAGKVTLKGQPVAEADLVFESAAAPDSPVTGRAAADGAYVLDYGTLRGLPLGKCKVTVSYYTLRNGQPLPDGEDSATLKNQPEKVLKHVHVFEKDVTGAGELSFELSEVKKTVE